MGEVKLGICFNYNLFLTAELLRAVRRLSILCDYLRARYVLRVWTWEPFPTKYLLEPGTLAQFLV